MREALSDKTVRLILNDIKILEGIVGSESDSALEVYIKLAYNKILDRTNRTKFPSDLEYLLIDLARDAYTAVKACKNDNNQNIQSMSEAGRSVTFGTSQAEVTKATQIINRQIQEYDTIINRYRLLYKVGGSSE